MMFGFIQRTLIRTYAQVRRTGVLENPVCKRCFREFYFLYKRFLEDPLVTLLKIQPKICAGGLVVDVGANFGYTSVLFSEYLDPQQVVIAFEPDRDNFKMLEEVVGRNSRVVPVWAAVGEDTGEVSFWSNPEHHADSRTITDAFKGSLAADQSTYKVPLVSVDSYLEQERPGRSVALIKIDVQGYEEKVLQGCSKIIEQNPAIVIAMEFCPEASRELGFDPEFQLSFFESRGFNLYFLNRRNGLRAFDRRTLPQELGERGYCDIVASRALLLPAP